MLRFELQIDDITEAEVAELLVPLMEACDVVRDRAKMRLSPMPTDNHDDCVYCLNGMLHPTNTKEDER